MSEYPRPAGEYPGGANLDPQQLNPQLIFGMYLEAAAGMPAGNRAEHLTGFAVSLEDTNPEAYWHVMAAAKDALRETWDNPETADETIGGAQGIATSMARATLDEELIAQAFESEQDELLTQLAIKRRDPTLVPADRDCQDTYLRGMAARYGDAQNIHAIADPTTRALAYKEVFTTLDIETVGPAEWIALEEEAWHSIITMPADIDDNYKFTIAGFAADHGTSFIERITDPKIRHMAYRTFAGKVMIGDEHAFDREWLKQRLTAETRELRDKDIDTIQRMVSTINKVSQCFADPDFAEEVLPDELMDSKPVIINNARKQRALRNLDGEAALALPLDTHEFEGRDYILYQIATKTVDLELAAKIPDDAYRMLAYSVIAGKTQAATLKEEVAQFALGALGQREDHTEDWGIAPLIINLNDPEISRRLLAHPNITPSTIMSVARATNDIELALAIPDDLRRASIVSELAAKLVRPDLLDIPGVEINPTMRAYALRKIYHAVAGTKVVD